jgi:LPXTG-motif cell wall-anchored protein
MFLTNPLWLTALATLVTSLAALVWAFRRRR